MPFTQAFALPSTPLRVDDYVTSPLAVSLTEISLQEMAQERTWWHKSKSWFANLPKMTIDLYQSNIGLLLIAASQLFFTFMSIAVKFLNNLKDPVPTLELVFVRMFITYCFCVTYMIVRKIPHAVLGPPQVRSLLVFRGVSGFFGLFGLYFSLKSLSLSDAIVLTFLSPTTTSIAGFLFLHENLSRKEVFAGLLSFLGVILIAQPQSLFGAAEETPQSILDIGGTGDATTSTQRLIAVGVSMLGVLGSTGAYTSLRAIGTRAHAMHSLAFFSSYSIIVSTVGMLILRITPVIPKQWSWCGLLFALSISGFIGQVLLVMGLQRETASRGTLALYVQIIFASILQRLIFKVVPSYLSMLGTVIIMGSAVYVALNKDTTPNAYKRISQATEDPESHELEDTQQSPGIEGANDSDAIVLKSPPLHDGAHV